MRHHPDRRGVHALGKLIPAKDPDTQESRFQEESQQSFDRQRRPKDIADKAGIFRPVHPKLEFLDDACDHPQGEVDHKQFAPKLRHPQVKFLARAHIERLHERHQEGQPQSEGDEEEVVNRGDCKLQTRKRKHIHRLLLIQAEAKLHREAPGCIEQPHF